MNFIQLNKQEPQQIEFLKQEDFNLTQDPIFNHALRAAEAHKRVRSNLHKILKPGCSLFEIVNSVENDTRILLNGEKNNGIGFPCGISLNNCAAHFSLNPGDKDIILKATDVLKIDFGTHVNGRIMDSAFTVCFDNKYEELLKATKEATATGLKVVGIDTPVSEIGKEISEVFRSFEIEINGKILPIKPVYNLHGHSIEQFKIHGGISIPPVNNGDFTRIKEGFYAIETFGSTGRGEVDNFGESSHFMLSKENSSRLYNKKTEEVYNVIKKEFGTLPFSPKHLEYYISDPLTSVKLLSIRKFIDQYPPLSDIPGSMIAQFEHTIYLTENSKTVMTDSFDY